MASPDGLWTMGDMHPELWKDGQHPARSLQADGGCRAASQNANRIRGSLELTLLGPW